MEHTTAHQQHSINDSDSFRSPPQIQSIGGEISDVDIAWVQNLNISSKETLLTYNYTFHIRNIQDVREPDIEVTWIQDLNIGHKETLLSYNHMGSS